MPGIGSLMNAVVTISVGDDYKRMASYTHPTIKNYAQRIGADFVCIDKVKLSSTSICWEKCQLFELLNKYERIIYLDTDIIVRDDCPNLFQIVPPLELGMFNEANFTDRPFNLLLDVCKEYEEKVPEWNGKYYNAGVIVLSRCHKYLFKHPGKEAGSFYDQTYLNMRIALDDDLKVFELPYQYNRMTCVDRYTGEERHASYIIHYAGCPNIDLAISLIQRDRLRWKNDSGSYCYKTHIYVRVSGGLGDQFCAEPAIRFMRENIYPDAEIVVATHYPRLFSHLDVPVVEHGNFIFEDDTPYYMVDSLPGPDTITWSIVSHLLCHPVDYCSIALLRRTLPLEDKTPRLKVNSESITNLLDITGLHSLNDLVLVHPGRGWESKTFPVEYWQDIIDGLAGEGIPTAVIGRNDATNGTVAVRCSSSVIDLCDLLDLDGLITLISCAKILVSNDSAPIHLAGAFDNWIVLLPSCKHPDHVLPYRHGSPYYKAVALYKDLLCTKFDSRPTNTLSSTGDNLVGEWSDYLLPSYEVVSEIKKI